MIGEPATDPDRAITQFWGALGLALVASIVAVWLLSGLALVTIASAGALATASATSSGRGPISVRLRRWAAR